MATTTRPTSTIEVNAMLNANANFHGIAADDRSGRAHYLLGMCEALLAQANADLQRLELRVARLESELAQVDAERSY